MRTKHTMGNGVFWTSASRKLFSKDLPCCLFTLNKVTSQSRGGLLPCQSTPQTNAVLITSWLRGSGMRSFDATSEIKQNIFSARYECPFGGVAYFPRNITLCFFCEQFNIYATLVMFLLTSFRCFF